MGFFRDLLDVPSLRSENAKLRKELESERQRHRDREERLIDQILTAAGRYGIKERSIPTQDNNQQLPPPMPLSALEEAQRNAFLESAAEEGRPPQEAMKLFDIWKAGGPMPFQLDTNLIEN